MSMLDWRPDRVEELRRRVAAGEPYNDIKSEMRCSSATLYKAMQQYDVQRYHKTWDAQSAAEFLDLLEPEIRAGMTVAQAAVKHGTSRGNVARLAKMVGRDFTMRAICGREPPKKDLSKQTHPLRPGSDVKIGQSWLIPEHVRRDMGGRRFEDAPNIVTRQPRYIAAVSQAPIGASSAALAAL